MDKQPNISPKEKEELFDGFIERLKGSKAKFHWKLDYGQAIRTKEKFKDPEDHNVGPHCPLSGVAAHLFDGEEIEPCDPNKPAKLLHIPPSLRDDIVTAADETTTALETEGKVGKRRAERRRRMLDALGLKEKVDTY